MSGSQIWLAQIRLQIHKRTEKAVRASSDGNVLHAVWLPLSQISIHEHEGSSKKPAKVDIVMPEWLAVKKGLL